MNIQSLRWWLYLDMSFAKRQPFCSSSLSARHGLARTQVWWIAWKCQAQSTLWQWLCTKSIVTVLPHKHIDGLVQDCSISSAIVTVLQHKHIDGLVQDCSISSAHALEILQSGTKPSICSYPWHRLSFCLLSNWMDDAVIARGLRNK